MRTQSVTHDGHELGVDLVLMLLIILYKREESFDQPNAGHFLIRKTDPLELVKFYQHDSLLLTKMASERFSNIWDEFEHDRQRL